MPLKIALVSDHYAPKIGGVERQLSGLAGALAARGHTVHVFTTEPGGAPLPHPAVRVSRLPYQRLEPAGVALPNFAKLPEVRRVLKSEDFDVVHAHGMFSILAIGFVLAAARLRIPSVFTLHSMIHPAVLPITRAMFAIWARHATVVTAVSEAVAVDARQAAGRSDVAVVPNGIDLREWRGQLREPDGDRLVSVMRLVRKKHPAALIKALPAGIDLTIVGDGPERSALERECRRRGKTGQVRFAGALSAAGVRSELAAANIFAHPTRREAFGLAALEAGCAGLPVIGFGEGGLPELVQHGRTGLLVDTIDQFGSAIARLAADRPLRAQMRRAALAGLGRFDWGRVVEQHLDTYERARLMRSGNRPHRGIA